MAGKLILTAPNAYMALAKVDIYFEGYKVASLSRNEKAEFEISKDTYINAKFGLRPWAGEFLIKGDKITEVGMSFSSNYKPSFFIIKEQSIQEYESQDRDTPIYDLQGARGRHMFVYDDKCVISTKAGFGSFITGNSSDGEKTIYYSDVLGVQFKRSGVQLGYLQLETASASMNNRGDNFFNENSFTFGSDLDIIMEEVQEFVKKKVDEAKKQKNAPVVVAGGFSNADELKKFKELLDMGIITQEEFDAKKKQLLGL